MEGGRIVRIWIEAREAFVVVVGALGGWIFQNTSRTNVRACYSCNNLTLLAI